MDRNEVQGAGADLIPVFDLDGTLLDSDAALVAPFHAVGVRREDVTFGHVLGDECRRLGVDIDDYLDCYDDTAAQPFPGVTELVSRLDRWAVCSNKHPRSGRAELDRLGWMPEVVFFSDSFEGPKQLAPVLEALAVTGEETVFIGDTDHDRRCAAAVGCRFVLAAWNPRAVPAVGDLVATVPLDVLEHMSPSR